MSVDVNIYDARFFTNAVKLEAPSARAVADILNKHFAPHLIDPSEYSYARVYRTEKHRRGGYLPIVSEIVLGELGDEREICIDSSKKNITLVQWAKKWFLGIEQTSIEERILNLKPNI